MSSVLDKNGYTIKKKYLDNKDITELRNELTVTPYVSYNDDVKSFKVYNETRTKITVPRYYGIKKFGKPKKNKLKGENKDIQFKGVLRENQKKIVSRTIEHLKYNKGGILSVGCASGKCLAKGTKVMMYSGLVKSVENIRVGEYLMGDDSEPRLVRSLARGSEEMYDIITPYNSKYTVNKSHILSLKCTETDEIIDISVKKYLKLSNNAKKKLKGYRVPVDFPEKMIFQDPYIIGYWLGLRTRNNINYKLRRINDFSKSLKYYNLDRILHIPYEFKCNKKEVRMNILAGIIDGNKTLEYRNKLFANDVIYLARSLGFICYPEYINNKIKLVLIGKNLSKLPTINKLHDTDCDLTYDIDVKFVGIDDYYGFEIDGNRRFLLSDFTVTHNTVMALYLSSYFKAKTLVLVHKSFLLDQWVARAKEFTNAKIGIIRQNQIPDDDCDIVIGMIQSISMRKYDSKIFKNFKLLCVDECHHYASPVFSQGIRKCGAEYTLGLSATPFRPDRLTKILYWNIGDIYYMQKTKINRQVICKIFYYISRDKLFSEKRQWVSGEMKPSHVKMISNIVNIKSRNNFIINILNELRKNQERKVLVLSGRLNHLKTIKEGIDSKIGKDIQDGLLEPYEYKTYYYIGGMKPKQRQEAEENGDMFFGTYDMAHEGLDIHRLNTIVLATSKKDIVQSVGRIMRKILKVGDLRPLIIDIRDELSIYKSQGNIRLGQYQRGKYEIEKYYVRDTKIMSLKRYLRRELHMEKDEIKQYIKNNPHEVYIPKLKDILDIQKVEERDKQDVEFEEIEDIVKEEELSNLISENSDDSNSSNYEKIDFTQYLF